MDSSEFRRAAHASVDQIIDYYDTIHQLRVVSEVAPGYLRPLLPSHPPEEGEPFEVIQKDIERVIMPGLTHWQSPKFMAFFPVCSSYPGILGELYSAAFNGPGFNWMCSPAVTELETIVLDWLASLLKLPDCYLSAGEGGGVIHGTASEAILTVMVAARERYLDNACAGLTGEEKAIKKAVIRGRLVALGSDQSHSCTEKAALIAGVHYKSVPCSLQDDLSLKGANLRKSLEECAQAGLEPFYLTATLGTTATCAVDDFEEIAGISKEARGLWVHVDAAYAGSALICEEFHHLTQHFETFNSFNVNLHKWLLTNFDASCLYIKRRTDLTNALSITPSYLRNDFSASGLVTDYRDWQIPLGRRFRALKIWFVMRSFGTAKLKEHIRKGIRLGRLFHSLVQSRQDIFHVFTPPAFGLTVLSIVLPLSIRSDGQIIGQSHGTGISEDPRGIYGEKMMTRQRNARGNEITKEVYDLINTQGEYFLTSAIVDGIFVIRVVSANEKAEEQFVRQAFHHLVLAAEDVLSKLDSNK